MDEELGYDLETSTIDPLDQYDLQDPAKRKYGKMPKGLRAYWRKYDMAHRKRGHKKSKGTYDPAHRPKSREKSKSHKARVFPKFDMAKKYTKRRHDPALLLPPSVARFWGAVLQAPVTALGGIIHNAAVMKWPKLAGALKIGENAVGYLGLVGAGVGAALDLQDPPSVFGSVANSFGSGMLTEAINLPRIEGLVTRPTLNALAKAGQAPALPSRVTQGIPTLGPGIF